MPKPKDEDESQPKGNDIGMFFHCKDCITELPPNTAPREFVHVEVGWTKKGLQVWCVRHEKNVINLDFMGQKVSIVEQGGVTQ